MPPFEHDSANARTLDRARHDQPVGLYAAPKFRLEFAVAAFGALLAVACGGDGTFTETGADAVDDAFDVDTGTDATNDVGDTSGQDTSTFACASDDDCDNASCVRFDGSDGFCADLCVGGQCNIGFLCAAVTEAGTGTVVDACVGDTFCIDDDNDGFGQGSCDGTDCDDTRADVNPIVVEVCDNIDNDCDSLVDEVFIGANQRCDTGEVGACGQGVTTCVAGDLVCTPTRPTTREYCDGTDGNCDGIVDNDAVDMRSFYPDMDGDRHGDANAAPFIGCDAPDDFVDNDGDCNDNDPAIHTGADESGSCGTGIDLNCDGFFGETDNDGDGYGACQECDDGNPNVNPVATDVCDDVDNDCDGRTDEGYVDVGLVCDTTGQGQCASGQLACVQGASICLRDMPSSGEVCDGIDNDCDGLADDNPRDGQTYFVDVDGDGFGDPDAPVQRCESGEGFTMDNTDCDDQLADTNPDGSEICDGSDNDCDGRVDEASQSILACDTGEIGACGVGTPVCVDGQVTCESATQASAELCNGIDDDCDGTLDEGATDPRPYFPDADRDGFGVPGETVTTCTPPAGYAATSDDCDDDSAADYPGAQERCDGVDNDCNGEVDNGNPDSGSGCSTGQPGICAPGAQQCVDGSLACVATSSPMFEVCDGIDNDCNGEVDDALEFRQWFADRDGDGYGATDDWQGGCAATGEYTITRGGDCDDNNRDVRPNQTGWFTAPRSDGSFDYNCDDQNSAEHPTFGWCQQGTCGPTNDRDTYWVGIEPEGVGATRHPDCGSMGTPLTGCRSIPVPGVCHPNLAESEAVACH